ncbi:MAG: tetratricopeptide repeat protein [Halieaceae bacterium]|jgi:tetratricopeptide (TPR) repeat protein|nr:tetratricopeptide repeat protein [Halieaceae bacterium]
MPDEPQTKTDELTRIQQLITAGELNSALDKLDDLTGEVRDSTDALYMHAVCCRHLGDLRQAEQDLQHLLRLDPNFSRAHQELGHLFKGQGKASEALVAYTRACQINPALVASWRSQLEILDGTAGADAARRKQHITNQLKYLQSLHKHLLAASDMLHEGKLVKAERLCRHVLQREPRNVEGMRLLADIGRRLGVLEDAEFLLESAAEFEPDNRQVRVDYVQILQKRQRFQRAHDESMRLLKRAPNNPQYQSLHAIQCMQIGDYDKALTTFDRVLEILPKDPTTLVSRGHALKTSGANETAIASYRAAYESEPTHCEAYYALANLKTYSFSEHELAVMRSMVERQDLTSMDQVHLNFALGKACEDAAEFETAFNYYAQGNEIKRSQTHYQASETTADFESHKRACSTKLFNMDKDTGCQAPDPIFIVGLPRAGSTLLEQILSSHSQVDGTLELPNILSLAGRLRRRGRAADKQPYPDNLAALSASELRTYGEQYIEDTRVHRLGAPHFIDKMPNNFRHIGLIKLILPKAKIIDARRAPMACCFSGYKQLFADGQLFSYSLADMGAYYREYVNLMQHWDEVLPGYVLRVQHEDVVGDLEGQVRRMLDFCGLEFEESCLNYHETARNVRTPSSEQVRQPIYSTGLEQWRQFEPWLEPLKEALGPELIGTTVTASHHSANSRAS